ncbi:response regulator transcription factor, partial [Actinophytocola xanthii]
GEAATARQAFLGAAAAGRAHRDHRLLGRAALGLGGVWDPATVLDEELRGMLAEALAGAPHLEPELVVELTARQARALEDLPLATRAVAQARELGRPGPLLAALVALHCAADGLDADRRHTLTEEIAALAETVGDRERQVQAALMLARSRLEHADRQGAAAAQRRAVDGAAALRGEQYTAVPALFGLAWSYLDGRFGDVERLATEGPVAERPAEDPLGLGLARLYLVAVRREQGRLAELPDLAASYPNYPAARCALPVLLLDTGRTDAARAALAAAPVEATTPPWGLALLAEACVELADRSRAVEVYALLRRHTGHALVLSNALLCLGPADRPLGMLAGLLGRPQDAVRHFETALTVARRLGARPALTRTRIDLAGVLLDRGRPDDRARARQLLEPAAADAAELGMTTLAAAAERLRSRLQSSAAPAAPAADPMLTRRELEVLTLVARGLANKQIARTLEVSDKTVKAHVSNILAKVGAADRTQAAVYAVRHGLAGEP